MSDFDRNYAARAGVGQAAAIDAGLRAYMIRIYNYMAAGVALTGVVGVFDLSSSRRRCHPGCRRSDLGPHPISAAQSSAAR